MKYITSVVDGEPHGAFTNTLTFKIDVGGYGEGEMERVAEQRLNEICAWCSETFKANFIIMEHADVRIAGGWMDNARGWRQQDRGIRRREYAWQCRYELRCFDEDAAWFKMKWQ